MRPAAEPLNWSYVPTIAGGLLAYGVFYLGLVARRRRVHHRVAWRRLAATAGGLGVIGLALMSPLDPLADGRSFAAHAVQHELLLTVAPLLLLLGLDGQLLAPVTRAVIRPALRRPATRRALRAVTAPALAVVLWSAAVLAWHLPALVALAYRDPAVHNAEHLQLLAAGLLFWAVVLGPFPSLHRPGATRKLAYLAIICGVCGVVAAVLVFSPTMLYRVPYATGPHWLGLSALTEQRLGGVAMMAVDMTAALVATVWVASRTRIPRPRSLDVAILPG